jgi:thiamine biosynthesis protein ThiI
VKYELIIVRYGEIALKGKETRKRFENTLVSNIKNALDKKNLSNKIIKEWGRIYVYTDQINKCIDVLIKIFGITSISPSFQIYNDMDYIGKLAVDITKNELNNQKSFAIRASRVGEHKFTSQDVAIKIGEIIVKATNANVNLTNPDIELFIEIRYDKAFIFTEKIQGIRGLPLGTQGKTLALIKSPESILAAWYLMRRGCKIIFVNIGESNMKNLESFLDNWFIRSTVFTISSGKNLYEEINKIATNEKCDAIVTNHSIFHDSKKTISEIKQLKRYINLPIIQPLIAMNIEDITDKCKEIGIKI